MIVFVKTSNARQIKQIIQDVKKIQNDDAKIWVISKNHIEIPQFTYITKKESFGEFLKDVQKFLLKTKKRK